MTNEIVYSRNISSEVFCQVAYALNVSFMSLLKKGENEMSYGYNKCCLRNRGL